MRLFFARKRSFINLFGGLPLIARAPIFIVNIEHIFTPCSSNSIVNFERVNAGYNVKQAIMLRKH